jgi:hypothetical protein
MSASSSILVQYPCRVCGVMLRSAEEGVAFKLRGWQFATCHACAPKVKKAAERAGTAVRAGLQRAGLALVEQHLPALAPAARALFASGKHIDV